MNKVGGIKASLGWMIKYHPYIFISILLLAVTVLIVIFYSCFPDSEKVMLSLSVSLISMVLGTLISGVVLQTHNDLAKQHFHIALYKSLHIFFVTFNSSYSKAYKTVFHEDGSLDKLLATEKMKGICHNLSMKDAFSSNANQVRQRVNLKTRTWLEELNQTHHFLISQTTQILDRFGAILPAEAYAGLDYILQPDSPFNVFIGLFNEHKDKSKIKTLKNLTYFDDKAIDALLKIKHLYDNQYSILEKKGMNLPHVG